MTWFSPRTTATAAVCLAVSCLPAALAADAYAAAHPAARPAGRSADSGGGTSGAAGAARELPAVGGPLLARPGVQVRPAAGVPALPAGLSALSWIVSDARTGQVLAAKDAHRALPPASTLKTLFAVTVLPHMAQDRTVKVTGADLAGTGTGSSLVGVQAGQSYTVADLWRGVFLASGNDAVHVLAHLNGSVPRTVSQMQAEAKTLGADDTHVVTPDGYDMPGQVSSAYDLSLFARAGLANPDFARYVSTATAQFPGGIDAKGTFVKSFGIRNTNRLLSGADGVQPYPGIIGVKNGYTTNAGNTLVAAARRGGRTLIATVMNPQSGVPQAVYKETGALLDWGFAAAGRTASVGTLDAAPAPAPAKRPGVVPAAARDGRTRVTAAGDTLPTSVWYAGGAVAVVAAAAASVVLARRRTAARGR